LPQRRRSARETQSLFRTRLNGGECGETFQQASDSTLVLHLAKQLNTFAIERMRGRVVSLLPRQSAKIGKCAGDAPAVFELVKNGEASFVERPRASSVALIARDVTLIVQRPGNAFTIADRTERGEALSIARSRRPVWRRWRDC
jgi:hypothetical protein